MQWLRWHPQAHVLLVGTSSGEGWMWKVPTGDCKTFQGHNSRNTSAALLGSGRIHNICLLKKLFDFRLQADTYFGITNYR